MTSLYVISTISYSLANVLYTYSHFQTVACYGNIASLYLVSHFDALYQILISLILHTAMFLNTAMLVYTSCAPLSAGVPASALTPSASILATVQFCTYCINDLVQLISESIWSSSHFQATTLYWTILVFYSILKSC